jgi:hypothetical protein
VPQHLVEQEAVAAADIQHDLRPAPFHQRRDLAVAAGGSLPHPPQKRPLRGRIPVLVFKEVGVNAFLVQRDPLAGPERLARHRPRPERVDLRH